MKLTYNVLCVDDKISTLVQTKDYLSAFNDNVGIETNYKDIEVKPGPREDPADVWTRILLEIQESFSEQTYDMILVDLHMPIEGGGASVIESIRESHTIYRPIVFYSAGEPQPGDKAVEQLNDAAREANLLGKGIFITSRNGLIDQATSIFKEMHEEEHKVNRVRGLLMDRVSEFDASIVELVQNETLFKLIPEGSAKNKILTEFKKYLKSDCEKAEQLLKDISSLDIKAIPKFLKDNHKDVSTYRKGYLLKSILKQIDDLKPFGKILSEGIDGEKSLREIRNKYGHTIASQLQTDHDDKDCIHIRREARRQLENIDNIHEKLQG